MYGFKINLAGIDIEIETKHEFTRRLFSDYICDTKAPAITLPFSEKELAAECERQSSLNEGYTESLCVYRRLCEKILDFEAMLLHSSALCLDGEAYLFTAPSGTGKSTHTRLWREYFGKRVSMINDDKPIIRHKAGRFFAYGTPYDGQHHISSNTSAPIKAICIIARSKTNAIKRLTPSEAVAAIMNQTLLPKNEEKMDKLLDLLDLLMKTVPVYRLECNISYDAVKLAYETMKN